MSDTLVGTTETAGISVADISSVALERLYEKSILLPTVRDYSSLVKPGMKSIGVPGTSSLSASSKSENTAFDAQAYSWSANTISLENHKACQILVEDYAAFEANVDLVDEFINDATSALAETVDDAIIAELKNASSSTPDHQIKFSDSTNEDLEYEDILEAKRLLDIQKVPMSERYMLVNPTGMKQLLQISNFIEVQKYGPNVAIMSGEIGSIAGFRVLMNSSLAGGVGNDNVALFWHASAVGFAARYLARFKFQDEIDHIARRYSVDAIHGAEVMDSGKRCVMITETA